MLVRHLATNSMLNDHRNKREKNLDEVKKIYFLENTYLNRK